MAIPRKRVRPNGLPGAPPRACDFCHLHTDVRWLDQDKWACAECARRYVTRLEQQAAEKKYTAPFTAAQVRAARPGAVFLDHGVKMRVTRIGPAYIDATRKPAFDTWAVPHEDQEQTA